MNSRNNSKFKTEKRVQEGTVQRTSDLQESIFDSQVGVRKDHLQNARRNAAIVHQAHNVSVQRENQQNSMPFSQNGGFQASESNFEIQDDFDEQYTDNHSSMEPERKKDPIGKRVRIRRTSPNMSHKQMAEFVKDYESLSNGGTTSESLFIHYDEKDKKGNFIHERSVQGHDKLAQSNITERAGGGASTSFTFDQKGNLKADVKLNSYFNREDRKGFLHKSADFIDSSRRLADDFVVDNNVAAASNIDSKVEILAAHSIQKHKEKAGRYRQISKVSKREEQILRQEIREEQKAEAKNVHYAKKENIKSQNSYHTALFIEENHYDLSSPFIKSGMNARQSLFAENSAYKSISAKEIENAKKRGINSSLRNTGVLYTQTQPTVNVGEPLQSGLLLEDKSVDVKQSNGIANRFMTKEEFQQQVITKRKETDKRKSKEIRRAAALAAFSKAIESKRVLQNEIGDFSGNVTGDAFKDGSSGLLSVATVGAKNAAKNLAIQFAKSVGNLARSALVKAAPIVMLIFLIFSGFFMISSTATTILGAIATDDWDAGYDLDVQGDGAVYCHQSLPAETIDDYISQLWELYPPATEDDLDDPNAMNASREAVLRYALSKVGCAYNQDYHFSLSTDIFDCSSLTYRSYLAIGINISNRGAFTAAEECRYLESTGKYVSSGELLPGDLIFYQRDDHSRYKSIGHVAIYIGRININGTMVDKSVEALGTKWGVVVRDTRSNAVSIGRPLMP